VLPLAKIVSQSGSDQHQARVIRKVYPQCRSPKYKENGHIHNGKQKVPYLRITLPVWKGGACYE